jgi:hypothetical protein
MKRALIALVLFVLALSVLPRSAAAATIDLGTLLPDTEREGRVEHLVSGITGFDDFITFELAAFAPSLTGTLLAEESGDLGELLLLTINLYNAAQPSQSLGTFSGLPDPDFFYLSLAAGNYFLQVHGDTQPGGGVYDFVIRNGNPAVIPIPPALLLFATALGGLGLIGYRRRRSA